MFFIPHHRILAWVLGLLLLVLVLFVPSPVQASKGRFVPRNFRIIVVPACQEDEVLRGARHADFHDGMWTRYRCWNPGW